MTILTAYGSAVVLIVLMALAGWVISLFQKNVNAVDSLWSLFFLGGAIVVVTNAPQMSFQNTLIFVLITVWAIRLSVFLTLRNRGKEEDRRYRAIRKKYSPNFEFKSLFIVYLLQALIASVIFMGIVPGLYLDVSFNGLSLAGAFIAIAGILIEAVADWQLYRFKRSQVVSSAVLNRGLWALSRHPNYFGEFLFWWGLFLIIVSPSHFWVILSPVIMTLLLLKVSGVSLMEKNISHHKPEYEKYIQHTPAFIPNIRRLMKARQQHRETI